MGFIADIFGAKSAAKGQKQAAQAATDASNASLAEQRRQYDLSRSDMQPWLTAGTGALNSYANLLGQNGQTARDTAFGQFTASPDYQFRQDEQARALTARNSALGIQDSGAAQKAAMQYGGNLASGEFNTYANRLAGLAGVGQTAASGNAALGQNYAGAVTNINQNKAQALGSSYINRGNIYGNLISNLGAQAENAAIKMFTGGFG
jgi:hypothetical protein